MDGRQCKICNKYYSSYKSLWNHNKKYHDNLLSESNPIVIQKSSTSNPKVIQESSESNPKVIQESSNIKPFKCNYCSNCYKYKQGKYKHEKLCKNKDEYSNTMNQIKKENIEIKLMLTNILKLCKIHPKTLQKLNNQLINSNNNINSNNTNNGTINNTTVNIVKFGSEEINKILSQSEILKILNRKMCSLEESIKMVHFNDKRPELRNIYITNLKDKYAYIFDGEKFIVGLKSDILGELVDNHFENIEMSVDEYKDKLQPKTVNVLDKFIDMMNDDEEFEDNTDKNNTKSYTCFKNFKINLIKLMIYNESGKRTNIVNIICDKIDLPITN